MTVLPDRQLHLLGTINRYLGPVMLLLFILALTVTVEPIYGSIRGKKRPGFYGMTSFKQGVRSIRLLLNGKAI